MRSDSIKAYLSNRLFAICPGYADTILSTLNAEEIAKAETSDDIAPSHSYEEIKNVAIITIDGTTVKKNSLMNAMSGGFVPYDALYKYAGKAEENDKISDILWHIDTRGGDTEGVDRLGELIKNSKKTTHTFYSNKGASAGIWYGSASDFIYAEETAMLGSIGVMALMSSPDSENKSKLIKVSKNAKNKDCGLNGDCEAKIQSMIDQKEAIFYSRVARNRDFTEEKIKSVFNEGSMISAKEALDAGFINEITTIDKLIEILVSNEEAVPQKPAAIKQKKGLNMAENQEIDIVAIERARAGQIAALGSQYGVTAEAITKAVVEGVSIADFKDVCLGVQSEKINAVENNYKEKIEDLESKLQTSIDSQSSDGQSTVDPQQEKEKLDEKENKILAAAEREEV